MLESIRCLIVDDDPDDRFHLIRMLRQDARVRYEVVEAPTGEIGMQEASERSFDVILLDYRLPGDDGLTILAELRRRCPEAAVVFLTGLNDLNLGRRAIELGAHDFLFKNELTTTAVVHGMRAALERRRAATAEGELHRMGDMARVISSYVPEDLVESVLATSAGGRDLGVQRFPAGILFGDIANFSSIVEMLGPEHTIEFLNRLIASFEGTLHTNGGILDKVIGDGVLAIFPAREPGAAGAAGAVTSGIAMVRAFAREWGRLPASGALASGFRVGISFGDVIRGNVGTGRRRDYTVVGRTVTLAKRLESRAPANSLLFDAHVHERIDLHDHTMDLGPLKLKGIPEAVRVYRLDPDWLP